MVKALYQLNRAADEAQFTYKEEALAAIVAFLIEAYSDQPDWGLKVPTAVSNPQFDGDIEPFS